MPGLTVADLKRRVADRLMTIRLRDVVLSLNVVLSLDEIREIADALVDEILDILGEEMPKR